MKRTTRIVLAIVTALILTVPAGATQAGQPPRMLFTKVHVFDGDPTQSIKILMDSVNIDLIMKDGKIYQNKV